MQIENDINAQALQRVSERLNAKKAKAPSNNSDDNFHNAVRWYSENLISQGIKNGVMPADRKQELVEATINSFNVICSGTNNNAKEHIKTSYNDYIKKLNSLSR